ncbi:hypothetical protein BT69DRAFT_765445 [Atractiella rhizophila]|nr:hypothetical protein BT69DRAFT_765445 [Atractiella rhizophila]
MSSKRKRGKTEPTCERAIPLEICEGGMELLQNPPMLVKELKMFRRSWEEGGRGAMSPMSTVEHLETLMPGFWRDRMGDHYSSFLLAVCTSMEDLKKFAPLKAKASRSEEAETSTNDENPPAKRKKKNPVAGKANSA